MKHLRCLFYSCFGTNPVKKPAIIPNLKFTFVPKNIAKLKAIIKAERKESPKTNGNFLFERYSLVKLFAVIHCFSKKVYHIPPRINVDKAAVAIAPV